MGQSVQFDAKKQQARTLADVRRTSSKAAKEASKQAINFAESINADITKELGAIRTQEQLLNIKDLVDSYASKKNRAEFNRLNSEFAKEARVLIDTELETITSREQLESIRSMVELNGSKDQKAKFAQFESYFARPTWEKYAALRGGNYSFPTSGVAANDRIAEEVIHRNNMAEFLNEAKNADAISRQTGKELAANKGVEDFLEEGDKLLSNKIKKNYEKPSPTVRKIVPLSEIQPTGETGNGAVASAQPTGGTGKRGSFTNTPPTGGVGKGSKIPSSNFSKVLKSFKNGLKGAAIFGGAALAMYLVYKVGSKLGEMAGRKEFDSKNNVSNENNQVVQTQEATEVTTENKSNVSFQPSVEAEKQAVTVQENDTIRVEKTDSTKAAAAETTLSAAANQKTEKVETESRTKNRVVELTDKQAAEQVAKCFGEGKSVKDDGIIRYYIVKKGDCVWNFAKDYLKKDNHMRQIIRGLVMNENQNICNEPSEDALILRFTKDICTASGIKYIIDDKSLMPKDTLFMPKYEAA